MAKVSQQIGLVGDAALRSRLNALANNAARKVMRPAIAAGLKPIREEARRNASPGAVLSVEASGLMKRAIKASAKGRKDNVTGKVYVDRTTEGTVDGKKHVPGNIAHLVEFGHGGPAPAPAHPFLRPALDSKRSAALSAVTDRARQEFEKYAAELEKQFGKTFRKTTGF